MSILSANEHNLGGAFIIQEQIGGMKRYIRRVKVTPSIYSDTQISSPFKKPEPPRYLSHDFSKIRPQYIVRPDLKRVSSRVEQSTPVSFAFSLANRQIETRNRSMAQKRRDIIKHQEIMRRPESARPMSAAKRQQVSVEALEARPGWDPSTQLFQNEIHGLRTLLSEGCADQQQPLQQQQQSSNAAAAAAQSPSSPSSQKQSLNKNGASNRPDYYTADGVTAFVPEDSENRDMKHMLVSELERRPHTAGGGGGRRGGGGGGASGNNNRSNNISSASSFVTPRPPPPGTLVREAARKILTRIDCMGDRVSARTRENIFYSASQILPPSAEMMMMAEQQQHYQQQDQNDDFEDDGEVVPFTINERRAAAAAAAADGTRQEQQQPQINTADEDREGSGNSASNERPSTRPSTATTRQQQQQQQQPEVVVSTSASSSVRATDNTTVLLTKSSPTPRGSPAASTDRTAADKTSSSAAHQQPILAEADANAHAFPEPQQQVPDAGGEQQQQASTLTPPPAAALERRSSKAGIKQMTLDEEEVLLEEPASATPPSELKVNAPKKFVL